MIWKYGEWTNYLFGGGYLLIMAFLFFFLLFTIKSNYSVSNFLSHLSHFPWSRIWLKLVCKGSSCTRCKETHVVTNLILLEMVWDLTLPHTMLSCQIYIKAHRRNLFHCFSCFKRSCVFCWCGLILLKLWQKWDLSQGPRCGSSQLCELLWDWRCPLGRVRGARAAGHGNSCGHEDPDITGSVAQEQAAKPLGPHFSFGRKPGF